MSELERLRAEVAALRETEKRLTEERDDAEAACILETVRADEASALLARFIRAVPLCQCSWSGGTHNAPTKYHHCEWCQVRDDARAFLRRDEVNARG